MSRSDKKRQYFAKAVRGATIFDNPKPGQRKYTYKLTCPACGWFSDLRRSEISLVPLENDGQFGSFKCEGCQNGPHFFHIQEGQEIRQIVK